MKDKHVWELVTNWVKRCKMCNAYYAQNFALHHYYDDDKCSYTLDFIDCDEEILKQILL